MFLHWIYMVRSVILLNNNHDLVILWNLFGIMATKTQCFHLIGMAYWMDLVPPTKQSMSSKHNSMHFGHANIHRIYARLTHNQIHKEGKLNWITHLQWLFIHSPQPPYSIWPIYESCILLTPLLTPCVKSTLTWNYVVRIHSMSFPLY
jgi:hypothetical protein